MRRASVDCQQKAACKGVLVRWTWAQFQADCPRLSRSAITSTPSPRSASRSARSASDAHSVASVTRCPRRASPRTTWYGLTRMRLGV